MSSPANRPREVLTAPPAMGKAFVRALKPSRASAVPRIPKRAVSILNQRQDLNRLAEYARVCGFTLRDQVPATWLHVLTFPAHVHLLSDSESSVGLVGAVHVSNSMTLRRPVESTEELNLTVHLDNLRPHKRGGLVDVVGRIDVDGEVVWEGVSTYLSSSVKVPGEPHATERTPFEPAIPHAKWRLGANLGRAYRDVSGDPNPIHTSKIAAKAFGFKTPIIHGMWTHARALAALDGRLPHTYTAHVDFVKPLFLPGRAGFRAWNDGADLRAAVTDAAGTKPRLLMTVTQG